MSLMMRSLSVNSPSVVVIVVGVTKMGIIVPKAGLELTPLAFRASALPLHHIGFLNVTTIPMSTCL